MGSAIKSVGATLAGPVGGVVTGKGLFGGLQDTILGKKDPGTQDQVIDPLAGPGRELQGQAINQYGGYLNQDTSKLAQDQTQQQINQVNQNAQDNQMRAEQAVAQRGLGGSSMGLNAILNPQKELGNQIGGIKANQFNLENQLRKQNLDYASNGINGILNQQSGSKIFKQGQASKGRQGGLAPLIGAGVGAFYGGPAGAQVGMGVGQAATQIG